MGNDGNLPLLIIRRIVGDVAVKRIAVIIVRKKVRHVVFRIVFRDVALHLIIRQIVADPIVRFRVQIPIVFLIFLIGGNFQCRIVHKFLLYALLQLNGGNFQQTCE